MHTMRKDYYYLEWKPQNPDGTSEGDWIRDPSFEFKRPEFAWQKFHEADMRKRFAIIRMVKNNNVVIERLSVPIMRKR